LEHLNNAQVWQLGKQRGHVWQGIVGDEQTAAIGVRKLIAQGLPARPRIDGHEYSPEQRCRHEGIDKLWMVVHYDPKRHTLREALLVQGDSQFMSVCGKTGVGDSFVRTSNIRKPDDHCIREAFSLGLDELS